jgi:hypothetical protein
MLMALMELLTTIVETCWNHKLGIIAEIWNKDAVWHENPASYLQNSTQKTKD